MTTLFSIRHHRLIAAACGLAACAMLDGCGAPAVVKVPAFPLPAPPSAWSAQPPQPVQPGAAVPALWWRQFHDPLLERLVAKAMAASTGIAEARAALLQARAARDLAAAGLAATVTVNGQAQRSQAAGSAASRAYNAGLAASWEPDLAGQNRQSLAAVDAAARASALSLAAAQDAAGAAVARGYVELRGAQVRRAIARSYLASQQGTERITGWRVQAGLLTSLEQQQAVSATEQAAAQLATLEANAIQLAHALSVLCGLPPAALDGELEAEGPIPAAASAPPLVLPAAVLGRRPDVQAAEVAEQGARARVAQAEAARYPALRLEAALGLSGLGAGGSGASVLRSLLAGVAGTAADGGAARARVHMQEGALAQARAAHAAVLLAALQDVEDRLAALDADRRRAAHFGAAAAAAGNAALLAHQRYASGLADYQTVLETQRALYASQDGLAATSTAVSVDMVLLYQALGGGWEAADVADSAALLEKRSGP